MEKDLSLLGCAMGDIPDPPMADGACSLGERSFRRTSACQPAARAGGGCTEPPKVLQSHRHRDPCTSHKNKQLSPHQKLPAWRDLPSAPGKGLSGCSWSTKATLRGCPCCLSLQRHLFSLASCLGLIFIYSV